MAIERNAGNAGNYISQAGEYAVKITETVSGLSKSGKPMLTVAFQTTDDLSIKSYFVKELKFHMKALESLKTACGLKVTDAADSLIGKECGILVEPQKPGEDGRIFMHVTGYGPAFKIEPKKLQNLHSLDEVIPF